MSGMGTAVSLAIKGTMTYTDNANTIEVRPVNWNTGSDWIYHRIRTLGSRTGEFVVNQDDTIIAGADNQYNPAVDVPFSWASAHTETNLDGASDGVSTSSATPSGLSDLATTDLVIGDTFMGNIGSLSMWAIELNQTQLKDVTS
jgi:hypothetical protein